MVQDGSSVDPAYLPLLLGNSLAAQMLRRPHDMLLLHRLCSQTQMLRPSASQGISVTLATKTAARMIVDWTYLAEHVPNYAGIHDFAAGWLPYRFGAELFEPTGGLYGSNDRDLLGVWKLDDLVEIDDIFKELGAEIRPATTPSGKILWFGRRLDPARLMAIYDAFKFQTSQFDIVDDLARAYACLSETELYAVATCFSRFSTLAAATAEIYLWHHDVEQVIREMKSGRDTVPGLASEAIASAYACAHQIKDKIDWRHKILGAKEKILSSGVPIGAHIALTLAEQDNETQFVTLMRAHTLFMGFTNLVCRQLQWMPGYRHPGPTTLQSNSVYEQSLLDEDLVTLDTLNRTATMAVSSYRERIGVWQVVGEVHVELQRWLQKVGLPTGYCPQWFVDVWGSQIKPTLGAA